MSTKEEYKSTENQSKRIPLNVLENLRTIAVLFLGALLLSIFISSAQNRTSEYQQNQNSEIVLNEIASDMQSNDMATVEVTKKFHSLNQSSVESLATFINYRNIFAPLASAFTESEEQYVQVRDELCDELKALSEDAACGEIYLVNNDGLVILSTDKQYLELNLSDVMTPEELAVITRYGNNSESDTTVNGTFTQYQDGSVDYTPITAGEYYTYSTKLKDYNGDSYFLVVSQHEDLLNNELSGLKSFEYLLDGVSVGTKGFLFAADSQTGEILYFKNGTDSFSGSNSEGLGMSKKALEDGYHGYQKINGKAYYLVSRAIPSATFGNNTVIISAVSKADLVRGNRNVVAFACLAFIIVAAIVGAYSMIIRTDIVAHIIHLENRFRQNLEEELEAKKAKLSNDEIEKQIAEYIEDTITSGKDEKLNRKYLKNRSGENTHPYFSKYISTKQLPLVIGGIVAVFLVSFFAQTLLGLDNATAASRERIDAMREEISWSEDTSNEVNSYVSEQYMSKSLLIRDILEEAADVALNCDINDDKTHPVMRSDSNGEKTPVLDQYGNALLSSGNNTILSQICEKNGLENITIFGSDGRVISTNSDSWYLELYQDEDGLMSPLCKVLDGKSDSEIFAADNSTSESSHKYFATVFYYYTFDDGEKTNYANRSDYRLQQNGEWDGPTLTRNRGVQLVEVDESKFSALTRIASLDYIMSGMHIYGSDSFFIAFDKSDDHIIVYAPDKNLVGKSAQSIGFTPGAFPEADIYHGFERINNVKYYISLASIDNYYVSAMIPVDSIYSTRNSLSLITVIFAIIFILAAALLSCFSSDEADDGYRKWILAKDNSDTNSSSFIISTPTGSKASNSIASRFSVEAWNRKSPEQKLSTIIMWGITVSLVILIAFIIKVKATNGSNSILSYILYDSWERGFNIFSVTQSIVLMSVIIIITKLARIFVRSVCGTMGARVETTGDLVVSVLKYGGIIGGIFYCLHLFGFDSKSLLASAGILSVVIGLGANTLIGDILAGIFLVFEGEFQVGDIVTINDFRGQVLEIGIRTTKIMGAEKNIKIFNNSSISGVVNMTQEASVVATAVCALQRSQMRFRTAALRSKTAACF